MIQIKNKVNCCGCTACMSICPKKCIEMKPDEEGFLYPDIDKIECTRCGLCEKACPILNRIEEKRFDQKAFLVNNKNDKIRQESTSGGAFTAIAEYVIEKNGIVFGATFDDEYNVIHKHVNKKEELHIFRNSKYVQSDLKNCFKEAKEYLDKGTYVCFSGTPCQIEGLISFLDEKYSNLITVDIVCHAVPSPLVWKKYFKYIKKEKLNDSKIESISFRDKSKYGYKYSTMTIVAEEREYREGVETDPYLRAFFKDLSDRPACYECCFKKQYRVSDFTIWDCFITEEFDEKLDDDKGTTRVLIHNEKAEKVFENIKHKFDYLEVPPEKLVNGVREMRSSVNMNVKRKQFFYDINNISEKEFFNKYFPDSIKVKTERTIRKTLANTNLYKKIKKIAKKILRK